MAWGNAKDNESDSDSSEKRPVVIQDSSPGYNFGQSGAFVEEATPAYPPPRTRERVRCCDTVSKKVLWGLTITTLVLFSIILLARSLQKLDSTEYGLEYTKRRKQLDDAAKTGGLHVGPPGFQFVKFPSLQITEELPVDTCLSQDGLRIQYTVTFQYVMPEAWLYPAVLKYRDFDKWASVVAAAGASAIQHSCADFVVTDFQNQRNAIQDRMLENVQLYLEGPDGDGESGVYARAISVSLRNVALPAEYKDAIAQKEEAREDIALARNQRSQATTKAQTDLLTAQQDAVKILDNARNDANITLTRATLKANETLFALQTEAAVVVRVKESLNLTTEGILGYMANRLYARANNLKVAAGEPARLSRKDEL